MSDSFTTARETAVGGELVALLAEDQAVRAELAADGSLFDGHHPRMEAVHGRHAARLVAIVAALGWPGRALAGEDGAAAAWTILQHAIGQSAGGGESAGRMCRRYTT